MTNVILLALDTVRADHLSCYGYGQPTSPALDAFAREAVLFENFFALTIPTHPSFTTVLTGMDAFAHQVVNVNGTHELSPRIKTLPELLKARGYATASADSLGRWFARGYDHCESPGDVFPDFIREMPADVWDREKRYVESANGVAKSLLGRMRGDDPFLLYYHTWDPHTPYLPPHKYRKMFYRGDFKDPANRSMKAVWAFDGMLPAYRMFFDPAITDTRYVVAQYDGEIRYVDDHVGRLLEHFRREGVYDDSIIVIFSDHGEILDDHAGQFDHHGLYDATIHVPLLIRFPGGQHGGRRIGGMCANTDILPTILETLGHPIPRQVEGRSLLGLIRGERADNYEELFIGESTWQVKRGVRTKEWKLIRPLSRAARHDWHGLGTELYHLTKDPDEQTNVLQLHPGVARDLEGRLDGWIAAREKRHGFRDPFAVQGTSSFARAALKMARAGLMDKTNVSLEPTIKKKAR